MGPIAFAELAAAQGRELGVSREFVVDQERINRFADLTEDHQWIHVDPVRAAGSRFGSTIGHGYLTLSLLAPVIEELLTVTGYSFAVNYGLDRVRFPAPLPSGRSVRGQVRIEQVRLLEGCTELALRVEIGTPGEPRPVCVARSLIRYYP